MSKRKLFSFQTLILSLHSLWPNPVQKFLPKYLQPIAGPLQLIVNVFNLVLPLHIALLQTKTTFNNFGRNLDDFTDALISSYIYYFAFISGVYFMMYREKLVKLVNYINEIHREHSEEGITSVDASVVTNRANRMSKIWMTCAFCGAFTWTFLPMMTGQRTLPVPCWYPFDEMKPIIYEIVYIIQAIGQNQLAVAYGGTGTLYMAIVITLCGQYDVLFCSLKNVYARALVLRKDFKSFENLHSTFNISDDEVNQYIYLKESKTNIPSILERMKPDKSDANLSLDDCLKISLRKCVIHHQNILTACNYAEDFFNKFCLIKSVMGTFQLCLLLFVSFHTTTLSRAFGVGQYLMLTIMELMLFTLFGHFLKDQSLRVGEALLRSPWYLESGAIKNDVLIMLPNTLRPVTLSAGKFFIMDAERLRNVVMSAFSYLTLLQSLRGK